MKYKISERELTETINLYGTAQKTGDPLIRKDLATKLTRIGLSPNASRVELNERKEEIERGLANLK